MSFGATGPTLVISTTATSKSLAWPVGQVSCLVTNPSTTLTVHVTFGIIAATAVIPTADGAGAQVYTVPPATALVIDVTPKGANIVACIASGAGPTLVSLTPGREG